MRRQVTALALRDLDRARFTDKLSDVVTWRAKDADTPVVPALIESAREVRPLLHQDAEHGEQRKR